MEDIVLEFGGIVYYLDLDNLQNMLKLDEGRESSEVEETETTTTYIQGGLEKTEVKVKKYYKNKELDISKYETYRALIEILLTDVGFEDDDSLGVEMGLSKASLPFKIAFNTLVKYGILREL